MHHGFRTNFDHIVFADGACGGQPEKLGLIGNYGNAA